MSGGGKPQGQSDNFSLFVMMIFLDRHFLKSTKIKREKMDKKDTIQIVTKSGSANNPFSRVISDNFSPSFQHVLFGDVKTSHFRSCTVSYTLVST